MSGPDVTPKTESGRALTRTCARCGVRTGPGYETELSPDGTCWPCAVAYRDEIIAETQEAASKAVAEVLDRLEESILTLEPTVDAYGVKSTFASIRALVASERKP